MTAVPAPLGPDEHVDVALLDPRQLTPHPRNVRTDLGDLTGLTASIAAQGVIEPLTVIPIEGGHQLVDGHRRTAAAITAGLQRVPCLVRRDLSAVDDAGQAVHVGTMLSTALHRAGLSAVEEARGVQTMLDLGADLDTVARSTGLDRQRVAKAAGVARLAPGAAAAVEHAGLTLDQAAVVARFEDAPAVVEDLVVAAGEGPGRFAHAVTRAEQERALGAAVAARRAELEQAGVRVVDELPDGGERLSGLLHAGEVLTSESHADCPGAAVWLGLASWHMDGYADVEVCTDPAGNGHTRRWGRDPAGGPGTSMSDEELERQRAERRQVIENNKAMAAANSTRRTWIRELLSRPRASKEVLRFAVESLVACPSALADWFGGMGTQQGDEAAEALHLVKPARLRDAGRTLTNGDQVSDPRLPLQLLAHVAGAMESRITRDAWRWRDRRREDAARWLTFLAGLGYELADVEQQIMDAAS